MRQRILLALIALLPAEPRPTPIHSLTIAPAKSLWLEDRKKRHSPERPSVSGPTACSRTRGTRREPLLLSGRSRDDRSGSRTGWHDQDQIWRAGRAANDQFSPSCSELTAPPSVSPQDLQDHPSKAPAFTRCGRHGRVGRWAQATACRVIFLDADDHQGSLSKLSPRPQFGGVSGAFRSPRDKSPTWGLFPD
jgi:hypothetical protein